MKTENNKLLVVLGMHRSGTSVITRGLQVMGVALGERLVPAITGNNEKGFWEDIDLNALDAEMLGALNSDWHHLAPIEPSDVAALRNKDYFLRAVELLRQKVGSAPVFGFKDPRVAKLLPFWKEVFDHCQFNMNYVLALRHPLSVAKSLAKRDDMAAEQGYLLWLGHVIESLIGSTDSKRILVDYDRLMQSPDAELMRISRCLGLEIDPAELQSYKTQFLDNELRHTVYELNDLLLDNACPPIVREVYTALLDVASDKTMLDDKTLQNKVARWADEFERLKSPLLLADRLYTQKAAAMHAVTERDGQIASLNQSVTERDGQIASLNQSVTERDGQVISLNQAVIERDGQVISLNQEAAVRQSSYQCHVIELETAVGTEQQRYFLLTSEAANLRFQLKSIMESRSWNLTAPLRQLSTFAHKIPAALFRRAITIYRTLPITPLQRQKLKNLVFSIFGFAFARMGAYQRWKEYRHIQMDWPAKEQITKAAPVNSMIPGIIASLPSADGRWEWSDYNAVKSRISQIKSQQLSQVSPSPLDLINIGNESFSSVAARVKLPALIAEPVVSIILPVFNNLKLTLECLLSITAHTDSRVSYEIILADDASTDETAQIVGAIPNLRILRNESNLGFLLNCNKALEYAQGQYVMYLNNDVQVTKDWLFTLYETFATHPNVGAAGPRFLYPSGHLQEAGAAFRHDGTADMVGLNEEPEQPRYSYIRRVDYVSGACLMLPTSLARQLGGFSEDFLPCYCEDSDLCLRIQDAGYYVYCNPFSTVIHHLSKTTAAFDSDFKLKSISTNLVKLQHKWLEHFNKVTAPRIISFYLPQFHPFPENDSWWGNGFTEWTNVTKAQPNFVGHYQPRLPADLGFYDLRLLEIMQQQAELASRYGVSGFCFYYYWFGGKRLLETPLDQMLDSGKPDMPFCLCWANENWSRRWDGNDKEVLMAQSHSPEDDEAVISDLIRYFRDPRYICIDGKPLILIYRVTLFPNFSETATRWRNICREQGIGEIYIAMVESMEMVHANKHPKEYGCDAAVEFPPQELAEQKIPSGERINPEFAGAVADYRDIAVRYATRKFPGYTRFKGVMPGWDNTARMQNKSFCFEHATPGALQAWLEETIEQTRQQHYGDERIVFVNAWNEWAEGAYLEPDRRFGHTYLEAVKNATEAANLLRRNKYWHGG